MYKKAKACRYIDSLILTHISIPQGATWGRSLSCVWLVMSQL